MFRQTFRSAHRAVILATLVLPLSIGAAPAQDVHQDARQNEAGQFDYYLLSLSWSPSFCDVAGERAQQQPECTVRPYAFVVHGLWPQYERGFPEYCQRPSPRLDRDIVSSMLDIMPAPGLVFHEWDRHGTCSGLAPRAYFETVRKARAGIKIPVEYFDLKAPITVSPDEVQQAFIKANPGLTSKAIAVGCDRERLREVRICLSKDLGFHDCPEVTQRACRRDTITMPPMRVRKAAESDG